MFFFSSDTKKGKTLLVKMIKKKRTNTRDENQKTFSLRRETKPGRRRVFFVLFGFVLVLVLKRSGAFYIILHRHVLYSVSVVEVSSSSSST